MELNITSTFLGDMKVTLMLVCMFAGETMTALTFDTKSYQQVWLSSVQRDSVVFSVVACQGAYVALSRVPGFTAGYTGEVALGTQNNQWSEIRDRVDGAVIAQVRYEHQFVIMSSSNLNFCFGVIVFIDIDTVITDSLSYLIETKQASMPVS